MSPPICQLDATCVVLQISYFCHLSPPSSPVTTFSSFLTSKMVYIFVPHAAKVQWKVKNCSQYSCCFSGQLSMVITGFGTLRPLINETSQCDCVRGHLIDSLFQYLSLHCIRYFCVYLYQSQFCFVYQDFMLPKIYSMHIKSYLIISVSFYFLLLLCQSVIFIKYSRVYFYTCYI